MKKIFLLIFSLIIATLFIATGKDFALDEAGEELRLYVGEVKVISVSHPTRIIISNPKVVDVANVTKNEITLSPKAAGTTTLIYWDNFGEQSFQVKVFGENMQDIKSRVDNLLIALNLSEVYTQAKDEEGKVILLGRVKTPQDRERISLALGPLKEKTVDLIEVKEEETLIEIDAQVLELNKDATTTLGFSLPGYVDMVEVGSPAITGYGSVSVTTGTTPSTTYTATTAGAPWEKLFRIVNVSRQAFIASIDALVREGNARILSRPRLACQSGKEAELMVGGEKPTFATFTTQVSTGVQIEYKEYGIKLKIKPTMMEGDRIKLALKVSVSDVGEAETIGTTTSVTAKAYPLTKRDVTTELFLNNGQTLAIGGLIRQRAEEEIRKTPFLGDIPILGLFFRKKTSTVGGGAGSRGDTELFITLTPTIIAREKGASKIEAPKTEERLTKAVAPVIKEVDPKKDYASVIQRRILDNLKYPSFAREAGFQGTVVLSLHLSHPGKLLDVAVKNSSGYGMLDDSAVNAAKSIASYPPFPSSIEQNELWIDLPIVYRLD